MVLSVKDFDQLGRELGRIQPPRGYESVSRGGTLQAACLAPWSERPPSTPPSRHPLYLPSRTATQWIPQLRSLAGPGRSEGYSPPRHGSAPPHRASRRPHTSSFARRSAPSSEHRAHRPAEADTSLSPWPCSLPPRSRPARRRECPRAEPGGSTHWILNPTGLRNFPSKRRFWMDVRSCAEHTGAPRTPPRSRHERLITAWEQGAQLAAGLLGKMTSRERLGHRIRAPPHDPELLDRELEDEGLPAASRAGAHAPRSDQLVEPDRRRHAQPCFRLPSDRGRCAPRSASWTAWSAFAAALSSLLASTSARIASWRACRSSATR